MISLTRRYSFSASHRLHVDSYTEEQNDTVFGKCNNPFGHGHNYELFVTAAGPVDGDSGMVLDTRKLDSLVERHVISAFHHRNINAEIPAFADSVPTTENVGIEIARRLRESWAEEFPGDWPAFEKVRIYETERNIFEVS